MAPRLREGTDEFNASDRERPSPEKVRAALDLVRPGLMADGGNLELLAVEEDGTVHLELQGACAQCPASSMTLRHVVEPHLRAKVPGVRSVVIG